LSQLQGKELPRVIGRTLDRTAKHGESVLSKNMRQRVNLPKSVVDAAIYYKRSGEIQTLTALALGRAWFEIRAKGKPIGIRDYAANPLKKRGVSFKVVKGGRRKVYTRNGQKAFFVAKFGGHVFTRVGADPPGPTRVGIKKAVGPSIPQFFSTKKMQAALTLDVREYWARELQRNIQFAINRRGAK
jgi:hypothetical protein